MIFNWLERRRLVRKGLACDKTRRNADEPGLLELADCSGRVRLFILALFTILLHFTVNWGVHVMNRETQLLVFIVFVCGLMLLELDCPDIWRSNSRLWLILGTCWVNLLMLKGFFMLWPGQDETSLTRLYFISPLTFAPFLITLLLGARAGLYTVTQVSILGALLLDRNFTLLMISLLSGFTAVYFTQNVRKRADLLKAGMAVGCLNLLCAVVLGLVVGRTWMDLGMEALFGIGAGIVTALVVSAILPIVETIFGITTHISWIEIADLNHPLLQQMTMEAPGTYHHSLMVANIVEAGAKAIGLNGTTCRVMAYFHDIGKIIKPEYFAENIPPGANPHENLSPSMSALIITSHVKEGIDLALKSGLKKPILAAIQQHHGDSIITFFYQRALQQQQDAKEGGKIMNMREEDVPAVLKSSFQYPGPRPQTKEIALLAIADSLEAASRSLEKPTAQRIDDLVAEIVAVKIAEHQLDECHLTLNEIRATSDAMAQTVKNMMHTRIAYDKKDKSASTVVQPTKRSFSAATASSAAA